MHCRQLGKDERLDHPRQLERSAVGLHRFGGNDDSARALLHEFVQRDLDPVAHIDWRAACDRKTNGEGRGKSHGRVPDGMPIS